VHTQLIEPTEEEQKKILDEVKDHIAFWKGSDRCKRTTVEDHLSRAIREVHPGRIPMENVSEKVDWMIEHGKLIFLPGRTGGYLQCPKET